MFSVVLIILIWSSLIFIAHKLGLTSMGFEELQLLIMQLDYMAPLIFIMLFCFRLLLFIPSSVFIVVGAFFFHPLQNIIFAIIAMFITETIIYYVGSQFTNSPLHRYIHTNYPNVYERLKTNSLKYLFILVASPLAPTDATCFIAATLKIPYPNYIITVLTANMPIISLYTLFGKLLLVSPIMVGILSILIFIILIYFIRKYNYIFSSTLG